MNIKEYQQKAEEFGKEAKRLGYRKIKAKDSEDYALRKRIGNLYFVISGMSWMTRHDISLKPEAKGRWELLIVDLSDFDIRRAEQELTDHTRARGITLTEEETA